MTERILVNTHGPNAVGVRLALAEANLLSHQMRCSVVICVSDKKSVGASVLNEVISTGRIAKMVRGQSIQLSPTVTATLESDRTISTQRGPSIVIALFGSKQMMDTIDGLPDCKGVVMVPWTEAVGIAWQEKWKARIVQEPTLPGAGTKTEDEAS